MSLDQNRLAFRKMDTPFSRRREQPLRSAILGANRIKMFDSDCYSDTDWHHSSSQALLLSVQRPAVCSVLKRKMAKMRIFSGFWD